MSISLFHIRDINVHLTLFFCVEYFPLIIFLDRKGGCIFLNVHFNLFCRLCIKTQPLDIVYNPKAISRVKEFFSLDSYTGTSSKISEIDLLRTAQTRYEELKEQTKAELKETWDKLLEADNTVESHIFAVQAYLCNIV